ncbi:hypothetical protein ABW21_db0203130 [Orbilia brochopaga]|nr:hypothetical protein ABW21_db0203130 [Drechslerella brochopaga]
MVALTPVAFTFLLAIQQVLSKSPPKKATPEPSGTDILAPFLVKNKAGVQLAKSMEDGQVLQIDTFVVTKGLGTINFAKARNLNDVTLHIAFDGPEKKVRINTRIAGKWSPDRFLELYQNNITFPANPNCPNRRKVCLEVRYVSSGEKGEGYYKLKFNTGNTIMSGGNEPGQYVAKIDKPAGLISKGINGNVIWLQNQNLAPGGLSDLQVTPLN